MKNHKPTLPAVVQPIPSDLASISEAAAVARLSPETIRKWIQRRRISSWGQPGYLRVSLAEILPQRSIADLSYAYARMKPGPPGKPRASAAESSHKPPRKES